MRIHRKQDKSGEGPCSYGSYILEGRDIISEQVSDKKITVTAIKESKTGQQQSVDLGKQVPKEVTF